MLQVGVSGTAKSTSKILKSGARNKQADSRASQPISLQINVLNQTKLKESEGKSTEDYEEQEEDLALFKRVARSRA